MPAKMRDWNTAFALPAFVGIMLWVHFCFVAGCAKPPSAEGAFPPGPTVIGSVVDCWNGKVIPVRNMRVYALTLAESESVRGILDDMKKLPTNDQNVRPEVMDRFFKLYEKLVETLKTLRPSISPTRTNEKGHFGFKELRAGQQYLILAINWEAEDEASYFDYTLTEKLTAGMHNIRLYMTPQARSGCR